MSTPIRRTRSPCCARAARGHATAAPPSRVMNARRFIFAVTRSPRGAQQERLGDRQSKHLGGGKIDDKIEFGRLLDWDFAGLRATQNLVDILGSTAKLIIPV